MQKVKLPDVLSTDLVFVGNDKKRVPEPRWKAAYVGRYVRRHLSNGCHEGCQPWENRSEDLLTWLGRQDSNLGMLESKSSALPLGDGPSRLPLLLYTRFPLFSKGVDVKSLPIKYLPIGMSLL